MRSLLTSRLHRVLSKRVLLVSLSRPEGRQVLIPLGYASRGDEILVFVQQPSARQWWRGLLARPTVKIWLRGSELVATTAVVEDQSEIAEGLRLLAEQAPTAARKVNVDGRVEVPDVIMVVLRPGPSAR